MYAKAFECIFDSSIAEDWVLRHVFEDLLKLATPDGIVDRTPEAISRRTNVPLNIVLEKIKILESADPKSASPEEEGRRIVLIDAHRDWGWVIVNYHKWDSIHTAQEMRERTRIRVQNHRERKRAAQDLTVDKTPSKDYHPESRSILALLNELTGRKYRDMDSSLAPISARLKEPDVGVEGVKKMIARQVARWKGDPKMEEFLRPSTLFGKERFNEYYAAKDMPLEPKPARGQPRGLI